MGKDQLSLSKNEISYANRKYSFPTDQDTSPYMVKSGDRKSGDVSVGSYGID